jgi:hypothetical protein
MTYLVAKHRSAAVGAESLPELMDLDGSGIYLT